MVREYYTLKNQDVRDCEVVILDPGRSHLREAWIMDVVLLEQTIYWHGPGTRKGGTSGALE